MDPKKIITQFDEFLSRRGLRLALRPTVDEIQEVLPWVQAQDTNPDWPRHVVAVLADLAARLGYGV